MGGVSSQEGEYPKEGKQGGVSSKNDPKRSKAWCAGGYHPIRGMILGRGMML